MSWLLCLHDQIISRTFHSALDSSSGASKMTISTSSGSEEEVLDAEVSEAGVVVSVVVVSVVVLSTEELGSSSESPVVSITTTGASSIPSSSPIPAALRIASLSDCGRAAVACYSNDAMFTSNVRFIAASFPPQQLLRLTDCTMLRSIANAPMPTDNPFFSILSLVIGETNKFNKRNYIFFIMNNSCSQFEEKLIGSIGKS